MKFPRHTEVVFTYNGREYYGHLDNYWCNLNGDGYEFVIITNSNCPDKDFCRKAPYSCLVRLLSPTSVFTVSHIIEGDVTDIRTFIKEHDAKNYVDTLLSEVSRNSTEKTYIRIKEKGIGFYWSDTKLGEWGAVEVTENPIHYDVDGGGHDYNFRD